MNYDVITVVARAASISIHRFNSIHELARQRKVRLVVVALTVTPHHIHQQKEGRKQGFEAPPLSKPELGRRVASPGELRQAV